MAVASLTGAFGVPSVAVAQQASVATTVPSRVATPSQGYDLNFTLPTAGKSGCMVCHGDKNLIRQKGDVFVSYWVDGAILDTSAHAKIMCTGCHLDFAYNAPHKIENGDWRVTAKLSCKNCHKEQFELYGAGVHSISGTPGQPTAPDAPEKPLCGDCHGSHAIMPLTDYPAGKRELHARGWEVCGKCHRDYWDNWADYYHGAAYRAGAPDAPACWQCHGAHDVFKSTDRRAATSVQQMAETCGQCHPSVNERYLSYSALVHGRQRQIDENPLYVLIKRAKAVLGGIADSVTSLFG